MRVITRLVIALTLLAVCVPAAQTTPAKQATGSITGRVTIGGKGLAYATVMLYRSQQIGNEVPTKVTTDHDGRYTFNNLAPGKYTLISSAPAYVSTSAQNPMSPGKPVNVDEGEAVENVDFPLVRGGVITGRITNSQGKPIVGEKIYLIGANGRIVLGLWDMATEESFNTDDRGIYRIFGLPAGRYLVAIGEGDNGGRHVVQTARAGYRRTYYPEATEQAQAKAVDITEGAEVTGVDIMAGRPLKKYTAAGRIIDEATGKPLTNIYVSSRTVTADYKQQTGIGPITRPDAKGNFRLTGLAPGRYILLAENAGDGGYTEPVPVEITDKDLSNLEIKVKFGVTLNGLAVIDSNDPPEAKSQLNKLQLYAYIQPDQQSQPSGSAPVKVNPDGSFRITGMPPGKVNLDILPAEGGKNFSIMQIERDGVPQMNGITVTSGEQNVNVKVVLSYGTGIVRGQIKLENGELPEGARLWVMIRQPGKLMRSQNQQAPDERGRFMFEGLATGEHEITVQIFMPQTGATSTRSVTEKVFVTTGAESQVVVTINLASDKQKESMKMVERPVNLAPDKQKDR